MNTSMYSIIVFSVLRVVISLANTRRIPRLGGYCSWIKAVFESVSPCVK